MKYTPAILLAVLLQSNTAGKRAIMPRIHIICILIMRIPDKYNYNN